MPSTIYLKEYKQLIEKLVKARIDVGLKQNDVAKKLKKPQSYISKIERCERRVDIIELQQIAKIYKKNISFFF